MGAIFSEYDIVALGDFTEGEIEQYIKIIKEKHPKKRFKSFTFEADGEYVNITYRCAPENFERIRRITGYLVGTLDRFNDAKRSEVSEREKHIDSEVSDG